jgi:hypothetical protein
MTQRNPVHIIHGNKEINNNNNNNNKNLRKFLNIDTEHNTQQSQNAEARRR